MDHEPCVKYLFLLLLWVSNRNLCFCALHSEGEGDSQHCVRFRPMQMLLDIDCCFRLDGETDEADGQEESGVSISLPCGIPGLRIRISFFECGAFPCCRWAPSGITILSLCSE